MKRNLFIICMMMLVSLQINAQSDASHLYACNSGHSGGSIKCTICNTSGKCYMCQGSGMIYSVMGMTYCPICVGSGRCGMCHGSGIVMLTGNPYSVPQNTPVNTNTRTNTRTNEYQPHNHKCGVCKGTGLKIKEVWMGTSDTKWCSTCQKNVYITHQHVRCDNCDGKGYNIY